MSRLMSPILMGRTLSPIPISANLSPSGYEYNSFRLPYLIRAPVYYCTVPQCRIQRVLKPSGL